ncbi:MAG: Chemotaxis protein CheW [Firmicutes bacterium]|nr:Chemotaxis protein CheW [candidate division NPL-UPA2 bacterium]
MQIVIFSVGAVPYALEALAVQEILRKPSALAIPEAPAHMVGVIDFRGSNIPLVNLRKLLGQGDGEECEQAVVLTEGGMSAAFQVDAVEDVLNIPNHALDTASATLAGSATITKAVVRIKERMLVLLDPARLLAKAMSNT